MRLIAAVILAAGTLTAQSNQMQLCDQQATRHCFTFKVDPAMTGNYKIRLEEGNVHYPGDIYLSTDEVRMFAHGSSLNLEGQANSAGTRLVLYPTLGTPPTDTISEVDLYRTTVAQEMAGVTERLDFAAVILPFPAYFIQEEAIGMGANYYPLSINVGPTENIRLMPDGSGYYGLGTVAQQDVIILQPDTILSTGTRNSHNLVWTSEAFDTIIHAGNWRVFAEATSTSGSSTWHLQQRHDADPYVDRFRVIDDGTVFVTNSILPTATAVIGNSGAHFISSYIDTANTQTLNIYDNTATYNFGMSGAHILTLQGPASVQISQFFGGATPHIETPDIKLTAHTSGATQCASITAAGFITGTGSPCGGSAGGAAGSDTDVQFNRGGSLGADATLTYDYTNLFLHVSANLNADTGVFIQNLSSGSSADSRYQAFNDSGKLAQLGVFSSTNSYGLIAPNYAFVASNTDLVVMADAGGTKIRYAPGGNTEIMQMRTTGLYPSVGSLALGDSGAHWSSAYIDTGNLQAANVYDGTNTYIIGLNGSHELNIQGPASVNIAQFLGGGLPHIVTPDIVVTNMAAASAHECVQVNTSGFLSKTGSPCAGGGGGVTSLNLIAGALTLAGTTNQITVVTSTPTITLSTPQDIATASSPSFTGLTVSGVSGSTQCLEVNSSGVIHGAGGPCGTSGGSFLQLIGGTMQGSILSNSSANNIGSAGNYWGIGYFGNTLEAPLFRIINGSPASVVDYFDFKVTGAHNFQMQNSSSGIVWRVDDFSHIFRFEGTMAPNSGSVYDLGTGSGLAWRNIYASGDLIMNGATRIQGSTGASAFTSISNTGLLFNSGQGIFGSVVSATGGFSANGSSGLGTSFGGGATAVVLTVNTGIGTCTITVRGGIITASTC